MRHAGIHPQHTDTFSVASWDFASFAAFCSNLQEPQPAFILRAISSAISSACS